MHKSHKHILIIVGLALLLGGCALYPAVQVAGGAMTGYDAVVLADEYLPRDSVKGGERMSANNDRAMERRLRERLKMYGQRSVSAHVIQQQAFLVGQFSNRADADHSIEVTKSVAGIKSINCKFFPMGTPREAQADARLLARLTKRLGEAKRLDSADLRIEVIRSNAIIVGRAADWEQKTAAVAIAHEVGGIRDVVDYIVIPEAPKVQPAGDEVASK